MTRVQDRGALGKYNEEGFGTESEPFAYITWIVRNTHRFALIRSLWGNSLPFVLPLYN